MPGPDQLIRTAAALPLAIVRRLPGGRTLAGLVDAVLPGSDEPRPEPVTEEVDPRAVAVEALDRDREPVEEAIFTPDDDFFDDDDHVDTETELVAESSDAGAAEPPGAQLHVDEPWEGYGRMKVAEIVSRLEGQSPEVLAAVELYETTHRHRAGVLNAARGVTRR
jgi:hypothetical protein